MTSTARHALDAPPAVIPDQFLDPALVAELALGVADRARCQVPLGRGLGLRHVDDRRAVGHRPVVRRGAADQPVQVIPRRFSEAGFAPGVVEHVQEVGLAGTGREDRLGVRITARQAGRGEQYDGIGIFSVRADLDIVAN